MRITHGLAAAMVMLAAAAPAQAQLRIHSDTRDKQADAAKLAWDGVELDALIVAERANLKSLLDVELQTQDQLAKGIRDHSLRAMIGSPVGEGLIAPLLSKYKGLTGDEDGSAMKAAEDTLTKQRARSNKFRAWQPDYDALKLGKPGCQSIAKEDPPPLFKAALADASRAALAQLLLDELRKACAGIRDDTGNEVFQAFRTGSIRDAFERYKFEMDALTADKAAAADAKKALDLALKELKEAQGSPPSELEAKVKEKAKKLADAVDKLEKLPGSLAEAILSEERRDTTQALLKTVIDAENGSAPEDAKKVAVALIVLPDLVDSARQGKLTADKPLLVPLLLQRDQHQLQLDAANRDIAAREAQVDLSKRILDTQFAQARELHRAVTKVPSIKQRDVTFLEAAGKAKDEEKVALYETSVRYLDSLSRFDAQRYKLEYMRVAAQHERALAYAEINIKQWKSLIGTTVGQVVEYGKGGIKPESITNLLNAAGVLWIGNGVNR